MNPNFLDEHVLIPRVNKAGSRRPTGTFMAIICFLMLLTGPSTACLAQTIRRVNNNPGVTGVNVYGSAQEAHDAANANDILLIEPGSNDYGSLRLTKPLKIYGGGYLLDAHTELSADDRSTVLTAIDFDTGSGGSELYGIEVGFVNVWGVSDCLIKHCRVSVGTNVVTSNYEGTSNNDVSNITLHGNELWNGVVLYMPDVNNTVSYVVISNNAVHGGEIRIPATSTRGCVVENNTIMSASLTLYNTVFENNICRNLSYVDLGNAVYNFNVSSGNEFSLGTGNQNSFDFANEFIEAVGDDEIWFKPRDNSPLKTAASDGGEVGAFGGPDPYVMSGVGPMPLISEIGVENPWTTEDVLRVTISATSNN